MALKLVGWDDVKSRPIYAANTDERKKSSVNEKLPEEKTSETVNENARSLFLSPPQKNVRNYEVQKRNDPARVKRKPPNSKRRKSNTLSSARLATVSSNRDRRRYQERKGSCQHQLTPTPIPCNVDKAKFKTRNKSTKLPSSIMSAVNFVSEKDHGHAKTKIVYEGKKFTIRAKHYNTKHLSVKHSNNVTPQAKVENHQGDISVIAKPCNTTLSQKQNNPRTNSEANETSMSDIAFQRDFSENGENKDCQRVKCSSSSSIKCGSLDGKFVLSSKAPNNKEDSVEGHDALPSQYSNETHFTNDHFSTDIKDGEGQETLTCSQKSGRNSDDEKSAIELRRICPESFNGVVTPFDEQRDTNRVDFVLGNHDSATDTCETDVKISESSVKYESRSYEGGEEIHLDQCGIGHWLSFIRTEEGSSRRNLDTAPERTTIVKITDRIISSGMRDDNAAGDSSSVILASDETNSILSVPNVRPCTIADDLQYFADDIDVFRNDVDDEEDSESKHESYGHPQQSINQSRPRRSYGSAIKKSIWIPKNALCNQNTPKSGSDSVAAQIGWDHEKCRPIFYAACKYKQQLFEEEDEDSSEGETKVASLSSLGEANNDYDENLGVRTRPHFQKRRVYGSTRKPRSRLLPDSDHFPSPHKLPTAINSPILQGCESRRVTFLVSSDENEKRRSVSEPRNQPRNDIDVLPSTKHQDPKLRRRRKGDILRGGGVCISCSDAPSASRAMLNEDDDFKGCNDTGPPSQVSSKTSLNSARAYFQHLDSNHNLTLLDDDDANNFCNVKNDVIRTSRKLKNFKHNPQFRYDYRKYCETLSGAGVPPISMKEFAENWNRYFTERGIIRDGLLDEE
mmetsp:Transcript_25636/g.49240  ORF Transcript_25636/g.49240 Transcript_25636/m.49240 type:complete len:851 (-) Transcript_25636:131-2683(-)